MSTSIESTVSLHERCQYPNKQCPKRRTTKNNGQLHRFCEQHKEKAKENQQRWLKNRVEQAKSNAKRSSAATTPPNAAAGSAPVSPVSSAQQVYSSSADAAPLDEFERLLFDEDEMNEFLDGLLLSHEELLGLQADLAMVFGAVKK